MGGTPCTLWQQLHICGSVHVSWAGESSGEQDDMLRPLPPPALPTRRGAKAFLGWAPGRIRGLRFAPLLDG